MGIINCGQQGEKVHTCISYRAFPVFVFAIITFLHIFKWQEVHLEGRCFVSLLFTFELSSRKDFSQRL